VVAVIPYNPLAGGLLTGTHDPTSPPQQATPLTLGTAAARHQERYWNERQFSTSKNSCGRQAGRNERAGHGLCWVLSNPAITSPVIGASAPEQLADSLAAAGLGSLAADLKAKLDDITDMWRAVDATR
jgi:aryl-alcohol dehydrogenase (NADP+)